MSRFHYFCSVLALVVSFSIASAQTATTNLRRIADLNPGPDGSYPSNLTVFAGSVLFDAYTPDKGTELWKYDGSGVTLAADVNDTTTDFGGVLIANSSNPNWLTPFGGMLYFSAFDPRHGTELWRYDGVSAVRAADINPDATDTIKANPNSSWPSNLTVFGNSLYFTANGGNKTNYELWKFDGTSAALVANIHPNTGIDYSSYPEGLTAFNGALYFMADDGVNGYELWKHNGTTTLMLTNINPGGASSSSYPQHFTIVGTYLYFSAYHPDYGYELWKTDGTNVSLIDINPGGASSYPEDLISYNGALYFRAADGTHGDELWKYDGTSASLAADINPGGDSYPQDLTVFGNTLVFAADDGIHGWELWKYDGANATLAGDLNPSGDSFPGHLTVFNGALYFSATSPDTGYEVWKYDGENISLAADVNPGPGDSFPRSFTPLGTELVFTAAGDGAADWELWSLAAQSSTPPSAPSIVSIAQQSGSFVITVSGTAGVAESLESSPDLTAWSTVSTVTPSSAESTFTVPALPGNQFFRVALR